MLLSFPLINALSEKLSSGGGYPCRWVKSGVARLPRLPLCYTKGNFHNSSCCTFELSSSKCIAALFGALWEASFLSDCVSMPTFPVNCQSCSKSICRQRSNKALPLRGHDLATAGTAYMILKMGFCEIMLVFVHTWHGNDAPTVTVLFKSLRITFLSPLSLRVTCGGMYSDYEVWTAARLHSPV